MPLPEKAKEFVASAVAALSDRKGTIHYLAHVRAKNRKLGIEAGVTDTADAFREYRYKILKTKIIREVGPRLYQIVSDVVLFGGDIN
jgi:tRNA (guanine37-N1)-methyltransferase